MPYSSTLLAFCPQGDPNSGTPQTQAVVSWRSLWCQKKKRGDTEKRAKSQTLREGTAFEDVRGNWQNTEGNVAPYFDSSGIWFSCLITTKEKKSRTAWRIFLKHSYFPLRTNSVQEKQMRTRFPPSAPSASLGMGNPPSLWQEHALTPK